MNDPDELDTLAQHFTDQKSLVKNATKQLDFLKSKVRSLLLDYGERDENGHVWLPGKQFMAKHEARKSTVFDFAKAEEYLNKNNAWEEGTTLVPEHRELTEDSFIGYLFEEGGDPKDFYSVKESWAVIVTEEEQVDY